MLLSKFRTYAHQLFRAYHVPGYLRNNNSSSNIAGSA